MSNNGLLSKEGGTVLGEMLKGNNRLKELDVSSSGEGMPSSKTDGSGFAQELAVGIKDNGTLTRLDISKNLLCNKEAGKVLSQMLAVNTGLEELDVSDNTGYGARDGPGFAQELFVGSSGNRSLTSLNLSSNSLTGEYGDEMSGNTELSTVIRYRTTLDIPFAGITALANAIPDMGALLVLSLQSNNLCAAGGKALAEGLKANQVITELNIASNRLGYKTLYNTDGIDMSGVIALADVISDTSR
jgi:Ran GTPase-activating protein (RanGAP) involved in mRNA processing and transport